MTGKWGEATWREGIGERGVVSRLPHPYARLWVGGDGGGSLGLIFDGEIAGQVGVIELAFAVDW